MHSTLKAVLTDQWPACPYSLGVRGVPQAQDSEVHLTEGGGRQVLPEYEPPEVLQAEEAELRALLGPQDPGRRREGCVIETRPFFLFRHNGKKILKRKVPQGHHHGVTRGLWARACSSGAGRPVGMESLCRNCPAVPAAAALSSSQAKGSDGSSSLHLSPRSPEPLGSQPPATGLGSTVTATALAYSVRSRRSCVLVSPGRILSPLGPETHLAV